MTENIQIYQEKVQNPENNEKVTVHTFSAKNKHYMLANWQELQFS